MSRGMNGALVGLVCLAAIGVGLAGYASWWRGSKGSARRSYQTALMETPLLVNQNVTSAGHISQALPDPEHPDPVVWLLDLPSGRLHTLSGIGELVGALAYSPDGRWLAAGVTLQYTYPRDAPGTEQLLLWDLSTGQVVRRTELPAKCEKIRFSLKGDRLFTETDQTIESFAVDDLRLLGSGSTRNSDWAWQMALSIPGPHGTALLGNRKVRIVDDGTGAVVHEWPIEDAYSTLRWDSSGTYLIQSGNWHMTILDPSTGKALATFSPEDLPFPFSKEMEGASAEFKRWNGLCAGGLQPLSLLAWDDSGGNIVSGDGAWMVRHGGVRVDTEFVEILDARTGDQLWAGQRVSRGGQALSPDGRTLAFGQWGFAPDRPARLGEVSGFAGTSPTPQWTRFMHLGEASCLEMTPDGRTVASGGSDGVVALLDAPTGRIIRRFKGPSGAVDSFRISADGRWVAARYGRLGPLRIWDAQAGRLASTLEVKGEWLNFRFHPFRSDLLLNTGEALELVDPQSGAIKKSLNLHQGQELAFSPDGTRVAVRSGKQMLVLASDTLERVLNLPMPKPPEGQEDSGGEIAFSEDGRSLAWSADRDSFPDTGWSCYWRLVDGAPAKVQAGELPKDVSDQFHWLSEFFNATEETSPDGKFRVVGVSTEPDF